MCSVPSSGNRQFNVWPKPDELQTDVLPILRENIVEGKYDGIEDYLDVHFRLLREDLIRPFRERVCEYIRTKDEADAAKRAAIDEKLNVYRDVRIVYGGGCRGTFEIPFANTLWMNDDTLKIGSLVAISSDNFETILFAAIQGRKIHGRKIAKGSAKRDEIGRVEGRFPHSKNEFRQKTFVVIEAPIHFQAYRNTFRVLQNFREFPLAKYIVEVDTNITPPPYVSRNTVYQIPKGFPVDDQPPESVAVQIMEKTSFNEMRCDEFGLNKSQFNAFRAALTKQLVLIQGSPGTGKMYVGLRTVQTLLENGCALPIIVVCNTNHALDQFLEGVLKFCNIKDVILVGDDSESEVLKECNLMKAKSEIPGKRKKKKVAAVARVIGMTPTGAAKNQHIQNRIKPKITIVMEAEQMLEVHLVAALSKHTEHLILCGDLSQPRPKTAVDELATKYKLDVSLFERLILNGMEYHRLAEIKLE